MTVTRADVLKRADGVGVIHARRGEPHAVDATYLNILTSERSGPLPDQSQDERLRPNNQADGRQRPPQLEAHRQVP